MTGAMVRLAKAAGALKRSALRREFALRQAYSFQADRAQRRANVFFSELFASREQLWVVVAHIANAVADGPRDKLLR